MVLRKQPPGPILPSAHAVDREYRVMRALGEQGVPVPNMISYCDDPRYVYSLITHYLHYLDRQVNLDYL